MEIDVASELREQSRNYLNSLSKLALNGAATGLILLAYSNTQLPKASVATSLMDKLAKGIATPDVNFVLAAIAACCASLGATGWLFTNFLRRWLIRPFLNFSFDLFGTALGVIGPVLIAVSTADQVGKALALFGFALLVLVSTTAFLWTGLYFVGERFQNYANAHPNPSVKFIAPIGATLVLIFMYVQKAH